MAIAVKRVYDPPSVTDGVRVLVDRLWPRGLAKEKAQVDHWVPEIAPSTELRRWFGHDPAKWEEFRRRYFRELDRSTEIVSRLAELAARQQVTLLFGAREARFNNAVALKEYLEARPSAKR